MESMDKFQREALHRLAHSLDLIEKKKKKGFRNADASNELLFNQLRFNLKIRLRRAQEYDRIRRLPQHVSLGRHFHEWAQQEEENRFDSVPSQLEGSVEELSICEAHVYDGKAMVPKANSPEADPAATPQSLRLPSPIALYTPLAP